MKKKRLRREGLPYTPSQAFIDESKRMLREKGIEDDDDGLSEKIIKAYRQKRAKILAKEAMWNYEEN